MEWYTDRAIKEDPDRYITKSGFTKKQINSNVLEIKFNDICSRCGGTGGHAYWPGFTCFRCGGNRIEPLKTTVRLYSYDVALEKKEAYEAKERERMKRFQAKEKKKEEKRIKRFEALKKDHPKTWAIVSDDIHKSNQFIQDMMFLFTSGKGLTENQVQAIHKAHDKKIQEIEALKTASPVPATDERIKLIATLQGVKEVDTEYGIQYKALWLADAGYKLFGSLPSKVKLDDVGKKFTFFAQVTRSDRDQFFGFYKRPTKIAILD